jgi:hypothetical protein
VAPWISLVIGAALVVLGIALLAGFELNIRTPRLDRGGRTRGLASMFVFGVSYAIASIGCELPIFLAAISGVFGRGLTSGAAYFVAFALGFAVVLVSLTVALALARQSIVHGMRRVLPYVSRIAGGLLVLTGAYVAWYGWIEIGGSTDDATVARVTDWSAQAADVINRNWTAVGLVLAAVVAAALAYLSFGRVSRDTEQDPERVASE